MKNYRLLTIIGTALASFFSSWLPVTAQTYNGASVYRDTDTIYKVGVTPNISVPVTYTGATIAKTAYSDACGVLKISLGANLPTDLTINRTAFTVSSAHEFVPQEAKYKCTNGVATYTGLQIRMVPSELPPTSKAVALTPDYTFPIRRSLVV
jgi:hypothetical protein